MPLHRPRASLPRPALPRRTPARRRSLETESADEVAAEWVARWNAGDYAGMYALTSGTVRRTIPLEEFASRYQGIVDRAELHSVQAEITGAAGDTPRVPFRVTIRIGHRRGVQRGEHPAAGA